jgi:hypothetical protein
MNIPLLFALGAAIALVVRTAPPSAYALDLAVLFGGFAFTKLAYALLTSQATLR